MDYHTKLEQFFKEKAIKNTEIAQTMGYSPTMISKYLNHANPNMEFLKRLVKYYPDIDLNYLFKESSALQSLPVNEKEVNISLIEELEYKLSTLKLNLQKN